MTRFPGIIPAVTTPFTADDQVDVAALKENLEELIEAGVHGFVACGTMGEAGLAVDRGARRRRARRGRGRGGPRAGDRRRVLGLGRAVAGLRRRRGGRGRRRGDVAAAARLPRRSGRGRGLLRRGRHVRPAGDGLQQPGGLGRRHARRADRAHLRVGRRASSRSRSARATRAASRRCCIWTGTWRCWSAATTGRWRASRPARPAGSPAWACSRRARRSSSTTACVANDLAACARRVPSDAPRGPLRHDPQARPVLQGRPGRRRLPRRPDPRAAPAAEGRRAGRARGGARDPARAGGGSA